jgi:hypothetical protein
MLTITVMLFEKPRHYSNAHHYCNAQAYFPNTLEMHIQMLHVGKRYGSKL